MKPHTNLAGNERGFVLIATMVILLLLLVLGISASTTSTIETQIAANGKTAQMAFFNADAGIYSSPKLISAAIEQGSNFNPATTNPTLLNPAASCVLCGPPDGPASGSPSNFYNEIMGFTSDADTNPQKGPEFSFTLNNRTVNVDIDRTGQEVLAGGGAEFASGASGVGSGSEGGVAILYTLDSVGTALDSALSELEAQYRKVPGTAGGL